METKHVYTVTVRPVRDIRVGDRYEYRSCNTCGWEYGRIFSDSKLAAKKLYNQACRQFAGEFEIPRNSGQLTEVEYHVVSLERHIAFRDDDGEDFTLEFDDILEEFDSIPDHVRDLQQQALRSLWAYLDYRSDYFVTLAQLLAAEEVEEG